MRFFSRLALTVALLAASSMSLAEVVVIENWHCYDIFDYDKRKVLVTVERKAFRGPDESDQMEFGVVHVAGTQYPAEFRLEGFNRRWDFVQEDDGTYSYGFVIKPDGTGLYYDFTSIEAGESTSANDRYDCVQK